MLRRTELKRGSGFKRPRRERAPQPVYAPAGRRATYSGETTGPIPKGEEAKPGKGAPTKEEREWLDAIVAYGCIACRMDGQPPRPTAVHHILRGGRRMGHLHSLPLCDPGHHQQGQQLGLVSRHPWKAKFEQRYGTEEELLARLRAELGWLKA